MSRVNSRVVFIIRSDLPSVPLLLLTHPGFALPKLLGSSWYSLPPDIPQQASPSDISFVPSLYSSLICLIHNYMSKPLLTHFFVLIFFLSFFVYFLRLKWWVHHSIHVEVEKEQKRLLQYRLYVSSQSQILGCTQGENLCTTAKVGVMKMCEVLECPGAGKNRLEEVNWKWPGSLSQTRVRVLSCAIEHDDTL